MSTIAANKDTAFLQDLLDRTGTVRVERPGTYQINKTLIIRADTRLELAPGVRLVAAPESRCALIENEHFAGGGRDQNISIIGGIWDGNCDEQGLDAYYEAKHRLDHPYSTELFRGKLLRFAHVDHIALEKLTVKDPVSYGIQIADSNGFLTRDIFFDYNCHFGTTDGVHINGPAYNGVIENLYGITNDDMVSLTTVDEVHAEVTKGEIANVCIRNVSAKNGYSGVRLLSAGDHALRDVRISGVYGDYRHNAVLINHHNIRPNTGTWFDDITVEHIHARKSSTPLGEDCFRLWEKGAIETLSLVWLANDIRIGNLTLRDISRHESSALTTAPLVQIEQPVHIDRLYVENISQCLDPGIEAALWNCFGTVEEMVGDLSCLKQ